MWCEYIFLFSFHSHNFEPCKKKMNPVWLCYSISPEIIRVVIVLVLPFSPHTLPFLPLMSQNPLFGSTCDPIFLFFLFLHSISPDPMALAALIWQLFQSLGKKANNTNLVMGLRGSVLLPSLSPIHLHQRAHGSPPSALLSPHSLPCDSQVSPRFSWCRQRSHLLWDHVLGVWSWGKHICFLSLSFLICFLPLNKDSSRYCAQYPRG